MGDFSDDWLALRAPADSRARADALLAPLLEGWAAPRTVVDLGAGSGANLRHLAPRLGHPQHWICIDHDAELLERLPARMRDWAASGGHTIDTGDGDGLRLAGDGWSCTVTTRTLDLCADLDRLDLPRHGLVTASALLDLVSADWLRRLLGQAAAAHCRLLFALSYDGVCVLEPGLPGDIEVIALVNAHQFGNKGFGTALGPSAADVAAGLCRHLGYRVESAGSRWVIDGEEPELQRALLDGWLAAALAMAPDSRERLVTWRRAREVTITDGSSVIEVGHRDIAAWPTQGKRGPCCR